MKPHIILTIVLAGCALRAQTGQPDLRFRPVAGGGFEFDTGVLRGTLRAGGKSEGLTSVVHIPSGKTISGAHGLVGHYRVLAANQRYMPDAWSLPSDAQLAPDGSVEVHWPAAANRPFEMWAVYRWPAPAALDVETRVRPQEDLKDFESFLASYFAEPFTSSMVYAKPQKEAFMAAVEANGQWQMFPRDPAAIRLIEDGRWKHPPNPVEWRIMPRLALPLSVRRDGASGITALLMAPAADCFAVSTPQQADGHRSLYLSLFGRDIRAGETARAQARLTIGIFPKEKEILRSYRAYRDSLARHPVR